MENEFSPGMRISIISRFFKRQLDRRLREHELTGVQFGVLGALCRMERGGMAEINQRDLENFSHVTHPTMTEIIKRLERKELISCSQSPLDRRFKRISSTEKARCLQQEIHQVDDGVFRLLCQGLDQGQIDQFMGITDMMLKNVFDNCAEGSDCR